jgi:hypothetical protein
MAYIPVNSTAEFVRLEINADGVDYSGNVAAAFDGAGSGNVLVVPALQDVTVNATPGTFRWKQLDSLSEKVVTIPSTNSVSVTMVLDDTAFFTGAGNTSGIFSITNNKTETYFRLYWQGNTSGDKYIEGNGYLEALAPTVNPDAPVWTSPLTIAVTGDYTEGTV